MELALRRGSPRGGKPAALVLEAPFTSVREMVRLRFPFPKSAEKLVSERHVLPGVRYAVDAYVNFARRRPWIEAVASSLTELFGPGAIRVRVAALERERQGGATYQDLYPLIGAPRWMKAAAEGDVEDGAFPAGLSVALINDVPKVADLMARILDDTEAAARAVMEGHR